MEQAGGRPTRGTGLEPLKPGQKYKLHFTPQQHGYLYIIAPGTQGDPTTYLTAMPIAATRVKTNEVEAGKDFKFPDGDYWMRVRSDLKTTDLAVLFSAEQLQSPGYLASAAGKKLTPSEYQELLSLAPKAAAAAGGDHCVVKALRAAADEASKPVIFDIRISRK
jgi:hypothetical protein